MERNRQVSKLVAWKDEERFAMMYILPYAEDYGIRIKDKVTEETYRLGNKKDWWEILKLLNKINKRADKNAELVDVDLVWQRDMYRKQCMEYEWKIEDLKKKVESLEELVDDVIRTRNVAVDKLRKIRKEVL